MDENRSSLLTRYLSDPLAIQLLYLLREGPLGRRSLTSLSSGSESPVRTLLEELRKEGIVRMSKRGTELTEGGEDIFLPPLKSVLAVKEIDLSRLSLDRLNYVSFLHRPSSPKRKSWDYRDLAVREGATGALLIAREESFTFLDTGERVSGKNPEDDRSLREASPDLGRTELVVVVSGKEEAGVIRGVWRVSGQLLTEVFAD